MNNNYENEVLERWGKTDVYREYLEKTDNSTSEDLAVSASELTSVFEEFAVCRSEGESPSSDKAKVLAEKLQAVISKNYYTCTNEILAGLGQMYVADERFKKNIDKNGEGTAEYVSDAIVEYLKG